MTVASRGRLSARAERWNTWLTAALLLALVVLVNRMAARDLRWRRDLSEDQLYALSDATHTILGRLEDKLLVKTYFTGDVRSGDVSLAKARILSQLEDLRDLGAPFVDVVHVDPSSSTAALQDTRSYGIQPQRVQTTQGTQVVNQPVYLGMLLRYRGREQVIGWAEPWGFEVQFASAVHALLSERTLKIGWYEHVEPARQQTDVGYASHKMARARVASRAELVEVHDLRAGDPAGRLDDLDVLVVVRPREEHPRAAFELEQFVRGGGRLLLLVDQADYNVFLRSARLSTLGGPPPVGLGALEPVLRAWGALPSQAAHAWDVEGGTGFNAILVDGQGQASTAFVTSPAVVTVGRDGFNRAHPITAGLQRATLPWAQPLYPADVPGGAPPAGVERVDLLTTSGDSYADEIRASFASLPEQVRSITELLFASAQRPRMPLAAAYTGVFPSVHERAPAPHDPFTSSEGVEFCDDPLVTEPRPGSVVVFGDADWLRDDLPDRFRGLFPFLNAPGNETLLMNVLDWLVLDEELIALRQKSPIQRDLRDFEKEALVEHGVYGDVRADTDEEARRQRDLRDRARRQARGEEWRRMVLPLVISLAIVLGFGLVWNLRERRGGAA